MPNIELYIFLLVVCLVFSAFFSGSETAFISLQRFRLEHMVNINVKGASKVAGLIERPERFLSVVLFGNTLVNAAAAALATAIAVHYWGEQNGIIIATVGLTVILLIFCEATVASSWQAARVRTETAPRAASVSLFIMFPSILL